MRVVLGKHPTGLVNQYILKTVQIRSAYVVWVKKNAYFEAGAKNRAIKPIIKTEFTLVRLIIKLERLTLSKNTDRKVDF